MQPMPLDCAIVHVRNGNQTDTAIARTWAPGDLGQCRLCPAGHCSAGAGLMCLVVVKAKVEPRDAWLFESRNFDARPLDDDPRFPAEVVTGV
jgi:membrane-associated PAP2 superfamily phosphatase